MRKNVSIDPSSLHLRKELSQILKATRVSRDAGTSSTSRSRSPLYSARSLTKLHYDNFQKNGCIDGNIVLTPSVSPSQRFSQLPFQIESNKGKCGSGRYDKGNVKEKEKRVFLYNWRSRDCESEVSKHVDEDSEGSSLLDCLSNDARNGGGFKRGGRSSKMLKSKYRGDDSLKQHEQKKIELSRWNRSVGDGSCVGRKELVSLVDESDYTDDNCDLESLRMESVVSSLISEIKNKSRHRSQMKSRGGRIEGDSDSYSVGALSKGSYDDYRIRNFSTGLFNEVDDEVDDDDQLDFPATKGCGIPCYWPKGSTLKSRLASGSCFSPSVSDALRRKQLFDTQTGYCRRHYGLSPRSIKKPKSGTDPQSHVPLLNNDEIDLDEEHDQDGSVGSLSEKYRPAFFDEVIGQNAFLQSLVSAISKGKISPFNLFKGPRGTGKSSTARIFAAALNCLAAEESRPCAMCKECVNFISEKSKYLIEIDGSNKRGICEISSVLKNFLVVHPYNRHGYKTIVVDECHLLPSKAWLMFLQLVEKPLPPGVIFVFITNDTDSVPHAILSICQKHLFNKISIPDIVTKLRKIAGDENLDVESDALELIASNADGSLRDAETMLDQLSLFGKRITASLVNDLIGAVSDDKLLELLDLAMSSNANETVIKARELLGSGRDPVVLTSQMMSLIDPRNKRSIFGGRILSESEKDKLKNALTIISEAQKHLRVSSQPAAWFMAILLQLGSLNSPYQTSSEANPRPSFKATEDHVSRAGETIVSSQRRKAWLAAELAGPSTSSAMATGHKSTSKVNQGSTTKEANNISDPNKRNSKALQDIWLKCIEKCHSRTLQLLLQSHGELVSLSETKAGRFIAHIAFRDNNTKSQAEGFLSSIKNCFEVALRRNGDVQVILLPDPVSRISTDYNTGTNLENRSTCLTRGSEIGEEPSKVSRRSLRVCRSPEIKPLGSVHRITNMNTSKVNEIPTICQNMLSQHQEENSNHDIAALKYEVGTASQKDRPTDRTDHIPVSPNLSRNPNVARNLSKDLGYESGSVRGGCTGLLCWRGTSPHRKVKVKQGISTRARTRKRISWFGVCKI